MPCQKCHSERVATVSGKTSDMFDGDIAGTKDTSGYVPDDWGIGGGDYIEFAYCLDCGQMQGVWPLPVTEYESDGDEDEDESG